MSEKIKMVGKRFGRLQVIKEAFSNHSGVHYVCLCDCGTITKATKGANLRNGTTKSCGCLQKEIVTQRVTSHQKSNSRLYRVWCGMRERCNSEKAAKYKFYGGRGISVCEEWNNSFENFYHWAMNNGYNQNAKRGECTLDRIDNNGNYEPSNCRWVDMKTQANNTRRNKKGVD